MWSRSPARVLLVAAIFWAPQPISADADRVNDVVAAIREAHERGDRATIEYRAKSTKSDLWLVVEHLIATGAIDAAEVAAKAVTDRGLYKKLAAYVAWRREHPITAEQFWAFNKTVVLAVRGEREEALERLGGHADLDGVTGARVVHTRASIYASQKRPPKELIEAYERSAEAATEIGWVGAAFHHHQKGIEIANKAGLHETAIELALASLKIVEEAGIRWSRRYMHWAASRGFQKSSRYDLAIAHAKSSLELSQGPKEQRYALRHLISLEIAAGYRRDARKHLMAVRGLDDALNTPSAVAANDLHLASLDAMEGRFTSALAKLDTVLSYFETHGSKGEIRGANLHAGKVWLHLRDWPRAREHLRRAREAGRGLGYNDAALLHFEALAFLQEGKPVDAERAIRASIAEADTASADARIQGRLTLASALIDQGRAKEALAEIEVAKGLLTAKTSTATRIHLLSSECMVLVALGAFDRAIEVGEGAQKLFTPGLAGPLDALLETRLATAWLAKGEPRRALDALRLAIKLIVRASSGLPDAVGAQHRSEMADMFALAVAAAAAVPDPAMLFELSETARAVALRTRMDAGEIVHRSLSPELAEREVELEEAEIRAVGSYRAALVTGAGGDARKALAQLNRVREDLERHKELIRARDAVVGQVLSPKVDSLAETVSRLDAGTAIVVYARGMKAVHALVLTRAASRLVSLGSRQQIEALIRGSAFEDVTSSPQETHAKMRTTLIEPLRLPADAKQVRIVPGGDIAWVPFAALLPERDVVLLPSVTVGRMLAQRSEKAGGVLAVGDARPALGAALPATEVEAHAIGHRVLVGDGATEEALRAALERDAAWRSVHLACHGLIDPVHSLRSALSLRPSKGYDGLWTVSEILEASVRSELVALSACSTARGKAFQQEGIVGFVHAFLVSGAKRVLVSLWDVDDEATAELMRRFYAAWQPGTDAATALRIAQTAVRAQQRWKHPAFWAGWQLWGVP